MARKESGYPLKSLYLFIIAEQLRTLPGIGPFFAQGISMRGAGLIDPVAVRSD